VQFKPFFLMPAALNKRSARAVVNLGLVAKRLLKCMSSDSTITLTTRLLRADEWEGTVMRTNAQFYKWYSDLSGLRRKQSEAENGAYLAALSSRLQLTEDISQRVRHSLSALDDLSARHGRVASQVRCCHACGRVASRITAVLLAPVCSNPSDGLEHLP
jgi:hypothetical protein